MLLFLFAGGYSYVSDPLNELLAAFTGTFVGIGDTVLQSVTGLIMILYLAVYGWSWIGMLRFLFRYLVRLILCNAILGYYDRPMSFVQGYKFHQIPSEVCDTLVSYLDLRRMDAMLAFFKDYLATLSNGSHVLDWSLKPMVWMGQLTITIYEALLWAAIPVSYEAVSILTLLLPLFVWTIMIPGLSYLFSNCYSAIWQAAFYRVTAAAIVFCATTSVLSFLAHELHGDYSVEQFVAVYPKLVGLMISWLLAFLVVGHFTSDLFKGTSSGGNSFGGFIMRLL
jgi:hypothetical protein